MWSYFSADSTGRFFKDFVPRLHAYFVETINKLVDWCPSKIRRNYEGTAFTSITINFGPRMVSLPHRDWANLSWGWCSISPLGDFDPEKGGHLVLWDLRLVIQFPPGSSITIPSDSNIPISSGEMRYSIAQYSASGLFRWVDNGCYDFILNMYDFIFTFHFTNLLNNMP